MADRIFGCIALAITLAYGFIAFTVIKAPFQYDPLGPEAWPRILAVAAALCCLFIIFKPEARSFRLPANIRLRISLTIVFLAIYAVLFEPLGFIASTALFCIVFSMTLGATAAKSLVFGVVTGGLGYALCVYLLDLNLPAGILAKLF